MTTESIGAYLTNPGRWVRCRKSGELNGPCASYDHDGDGQSAADGDCDDTDATIYDGAPEIDAAVDNDCDGDAELGPSRKRGRGSASNALECGTITLDGSASYDPSGDLDITFDWSLVSAPTASMMTSTDILDADTDLASFVADEVGTYVFFFDRSGFWGRGIPYLQRSRLMWGRVHPITHPWQMVVTIKRQRVLQNVRLRVRAILARHVTIKNLCSMQAHRPMRTTMDYPIGGISLPERVACMTGGRKAQGVCPDSALHTTRALQSLYR